MYIHEHHADVTLKTSACLPKIICSGSACYVVSVSLSVRPCVRLSVCLSVCLSLSLSACLSVSLPVCLFSGECMYSSIHSCSLFLDNVVAVWDVRRPYIPFASFTEHSDDVTGQYNTNTVVLLFYPGFREMETEDILVGNLYIL